MKIGTENKKKTISALVLAGIALLLVARMLFTSGTSTASSATPKPVATTVTAPVQQENAAQPKRNPNSGRRSDQKTISGAAWKPSLDPSLQLSMLNAAESVRYEGQGRNIFETNSEPVIQKPVTGGLIKAANTPPPPPVHKGPPPPPPINLKFYGFATREGNQKSVFLSQDGSVFVAREGEIVARRYKVVRINSTSVEIQDLLSNNKQTIPLTAG